MEARGRKPVSVRGPPTSSTYVAASARAIPRRPVGHRRACASLVAPFAAVVRKLDLERIAPFHTGALIATFHCARALRRVRRCAARRWRRGGRPRSSISGVSLRRRRRPSAEAKRSAPSLRRYVIDERRALVASLAAGVAIAAHERRSSIAARTRSVTSAAVAFHATECGAGDCRRSGNAQKRLTVAQRPSTFSCASPQYSLTFEFGFLNLSNGRA
jgi:hypothetical protein